MRKTTGDGEMLVKAHSIIRGTGDWPQPDPNETIEIPDIAPNELADKMPNIVNYLELLCMLPKQHSYTRILIGDPDEGIPRTVKIFYPVATYWHNGPLRIKNNAIENYRAYYYEDGDL